MPKAKKLCFEKSCIKAILAAFFHSGGLVHKGFVPTEQTVNANFYKDVLDCLIERINRIRPGLCASGDWFLQHDTKQDHNAASVRQFLAKKNVTVLHHHPYLRDLAPADYFLSPKLKLQLKRRRFEDIQTIKKNITMF